MWSPLTFGIEQAYKLWMQCSPFSCNINPIVCPLWGSTHPSMLDTQLHTRTIQHAELHSFVLDFWLLSSGSCETAATPETMQSIWRRAVVALLMSCVFLIATHCSHVSLSWYMQLTPKHRLSHLSICKCVWCVCVGLHSKYISIYDRLCGLVVRVPGYRTEMYCVSCEVRTEFIYVM
jgi:hypothetical protein